MLESWHRAEPPRGRAAFSIWQRRQLLTSLWIRRAVPAQKGCLFLIRKAVLYVLEAAQAVKPNIYDFKSSTLHLALGELPFTLLTIRVCVKSLKFYKALICYLYDCIEIL